MKEINIKLTGCGHPKFYDIIKECGELHDAKNADYATSEQPLGNFERVGHWIQYYHLEEMIKTRPALFVAIVYELKQLDAQLKLLSLGTEGKVEGVEKRIRDRTVYSIIEEILYSEGK